MQLHIANRSSFMLMLGLFSGLWQTERRMPIAFYLRDNLTQDDPEPDWDKLRVKYAHHEQEADAKWAAYEAERSEKNKVRRPRTIVGKMRLGYDEALNIKSGKDATSSGIIRNNRIRKRRRPANLEEMELAAYYAEPSYVVLRRPKNNAHWVW